ncbi:hypothetical protein [Streptomyces sp. NPDC001980]|uniref:hypothetical protein n=1 Tax=Streptomyces sp. NPDC001980 TaxID=3157126 RepID=UPI00331B1C12
MSSAAEVYRQWAVEPGLQEGCDVAAEHRQLMTLTTARRANEATAALRAHFESTAPVLPTNAECRAIG